MVFTQGRGFVVGASFGLQTRSLRCRVQVCRAADTASLATSLLFGKLIGVAMTFGFGEKRCRKNLPLDDLSIPMAQLLFHRVDDAILLAAVSDDGDVTVSDYVPEYVSAHVARWSRFNCDQSHAHVLLTIGEHTHLPDHLVVTVCPDVRCFWNPIRIIRDFRLSFMIVSRLRAAGGESFGDSTIV